MKRRSPRLNSSKRMPVRWVDLISWIAFCESAGIIGALFTVSSIPTWYTAITKPSFNPPSWIFSPVWIVLYALMGIAAYRVSRLGMKNKPVRNAVFLFLIHLVFNTLWSIIFFGGRNIPLGFVDISIIWVLVIFLTLRFHDLDRVSSYLMLPYLAWVSFATVLNYNIWLLNP